MFDIRFGWGQVLKTSKFVTEVKYDDLNRLWSYFYEGDIITLSFTEYTLQGFSQDRPMDPPEEGELVLVRDHIDNQWSVRHFSHYADGLYHCYLNGVNGRSTNAWLKCKRIKILD